MPLVLKKWGFFSEDLLVEDFDMWLRIAHVSQVGFVNEYLGVYCIHGDNAHLVKSERLYTDRKIILKKWIKEEKFNLAYALNEFYNHAMYVSVTDYVKATLRCYILALKHREIFMMKFLLKRSLDHWRMFLAERKKNN